MQNLSSTSRLYNYLRQYEWLRRIYRESRTAIHITQNRIRAFSAGNLSLKKQRSFLGSVARRQVPCEITSPEQLLERCDELGILYATGRHSIYFAPQENLWQLLGDIVMDYPEDAGFKILKNFQAPEQASYIANGDRRTLTKNMMGPVTNQVLAANALAALELGPPCYGLVHLESSKTDMTAFVVRHVEGELATPSDCEDFSDRLKPIISEGLLELVPSRGLQDPDFLPPNCNHNLVRDRETGDLMYIDFQQFLACQKPLLKKVAGEASQDVHFGGSSRLFRDGKKYLYQSVPGIGSAAKRDTNYRWQIYRSMLKQQGVEVQDRLVLDVCCNSGIMLAHALSDGAAWGLGWDLPNVVPHSRKVMQLLGASSSTLIPTELSPEYKISESIPSWLKPKVEGSVLFYLAAIQHVGVIRDLANVAWSTVFFEDHEGITKQEAEDNLKQLENAWNCRVAWRGKIADGDCGSRSVAILKR